MRYRWLTAGLALACVLPFSPAAAGPYETSFAAANAMGVQGVMAAGGPVQIALVRLEGLDASGFAAAVPAAQAPDYQPYVDLPVSAVPGARYVGCIALTVGGKVDGGCSLLSPITFDVTPGMSDATVSFSVKSTASGRQVGATLVLTGGTNVEPSGGFVPVFDPANPRAFAAAGEATVSRDATAVGTVRSDEIGGGAIGNVEAILWQGVSGMLTFNGDKLVCRPNLPCDL